MLPDQEPENGTVAPAPVNAATLIADAHLRAGKLMSLAGRQDDAIQQFTAAARFGPQRMSGIPMVGNAKGDTNFSWLAGAPASEASFYLAQSLLAKGDVDGANSALYEIGRTIPEHLRGELNQLNNAIARVQSQRHQPDPYAGMSNEKQSYAERQYQQDRERQQIATRLLAPNAKIVKELVGVWEMSPDNRFLPWKKTMTIESNANYTIVFQSDNTIHRGKADVQRGRNVVQGGIDVSRGQIMMYDELGSVSTMWYEFIDRDTMRITDQDGTNYEAHRQR